MRKEHTVQRSYKPLPITSNVITPEICGAIPRVEAQPKQLEFAKQVPFDTVMLDTYRAERLMDAGETADTLFPNATIILTSTFEDERLELWYLERELDVAIEFGADVVVPCDVPVYEDDPRQQRIQDIRIYAENVVEATRLFHEYGIAVIPLVKGEDPYERQICYDAFDQANLGFVSYYCSQYFLYGFRYSDLLTTVRDIAREYDPEGIMLIGFQSENYLSDFPPAVKAAAGFRWFWKSSLDHESLSVAERNFGEWERRVDASLRTGQTLLDAFAMRQTYGGL